MQSLADLVAGKTVALVGNADSVFYNGSVAQQIDGHDVVIRMNLGYPMAQTKWCIGERTDVWATAKWWGKYMTPKDARLILFMKLTVLGDKHWKTMDADMGLTGPPRLRWPLDLEEECKRFVGADPGTGIRLLWWLKTKAAPSSVTPFAMDCWESKSHWSGKTNSVNHVPALERAAMQRLLP